MHTEPRINIDRRALKRVCEMHESKFGQVYGMKTVRVDQREPHDYYHFKDNGASVLAVAHLDTVVDHLQRMCNFIDTADGPLVYSGALDDRLGAYIILELLPTLGVEVDLLLTVGEESGLSTAQYFEPSDHHDRAYNWIIEFDRGGTDVVMYEYEDEETRDLVHAAGAVVGNGSFSDISYMEHLGVKAFNWGVAYRDYHSTRGHAWLDETTMMVGQFLEFWETNKDVVMPHEMSSYGAWRSTGDYWRWDGNNGLCQFCGSYGVDPATEWCENCGTCQECCEDALSEQCVCPWAVAERAEEERAYEERQERLAVDILTKEGLL